MFDTTFGKPPKHVGSFSVQCQIRSREKLPRRRPSAARVHPRTDHRATQRLMQKQMRSQRVHFRRVVESTTKHSLVARLRAPPRGHARADVPAGAPAGARASPIAARRPKSGAPDLFQPSHSEPFPFALHPAPCSRAPRVPARRAQEKKLWAGGRLAHFTSPDCGRDRSKEGRTPLR